MEALLIVDLQHDFLPGGALAVPRGDEVIEVINRLAARFEQVVATRDWHPADHVSFASRHPGYAVGEVMQVGGVPQVLWPDHCVRNTPGASFPAALDTSPIARVFDKGCDPAVDSYSGFLDAQRRPATDLRAWLQQKDVTGVAIAGLALDYCVKQTALDAVALGFTTRVMVAGTRAVEVHPGDGDTALDTLRAAGVTLVDGEG